MGERALGWGLRLLSIALWVGPLIAALGIHGWDIRAAVMPSQAEIGEITERFQGLFGEGSMEVTSSTLDGATITTTVKFTSPFNFRVEVTDVSGSIFCQMHNVRLASAGMEGDRVTIQPRGEAILALVGTLTPEGSQHISKVHGGALPAALGFTGSLQAESYGVTMRISWVAR